MSKRKQGESGSEGGGQVPAARPVPVPPGNSFYERLAAPVIAETGERAETLAEREARRLRVMLGESYEPQSAADLTFNPLIAYEIAVGVASPSVVFQKYGHSIEEAQVLIGLPAFIATIKKYKEELTRDGVTFRMRAKMQAEDLLTHSYTMAADPETPPAVRADLIKWTAKVAGPEPDSKEKGAGAGAGFSLNITFAGAAPAVGATLDVTPTRIEEKP